MYNLSMLLRLEPGHLIGVTYQFFLHVVAAAWPDRVRSRRISAGVELHHRDLHRTAAIDVHPDPWITNVARSEIAYVPND